MTPNRRRRSSEKEIPRPPGLWVLGALFIAAVAIGASLLELTEDTGGDSRSCAERIDPQGPSPPPTQRRSGRGMAAVAVTSEGTRQANAHMKFGFGGSRNPLDHRQPFRVPRGVPRSAFRFGAPSDLSDSDSGKTLSRARLRGDVGPIGVDPRQVRLTVCIDPALPNELSAGTYTGAVLINAPTVAGVRPASLPVTVTVQDDRKIIAMLACLVGVIAGAVIRSMADIQQAPGKPDGSPPERMAYFYSLRFLVMIALGLLGGATAYSGLFANESDASVDVFSILLPLAAASFTATLAAKSLADLTQPSQQERTAGVAGAPPDVERRR